MGGRGSKSGMTSSSRGSDSARSQYEAAERDRERLASIDPSKRTPEEREELRQAFQRRDDAAYSIISEMSDSAIQRAADKYVKDEVEFEDVSRTEMRKWIHGISGTKKDGTPTATAMKNAENGVWSVINSNKYGINLSTSGYSYLHYPEQTRRISRAIVKAAVKYRTRFD